MVISFVFIPIIVLTSFASSTISYSIARQNQIERIRESTTTILQLNTNYLNGRINNAVAEMMHVLSRPETQQLLLELDEDEHVQKETEAAFKTVLQASYNNVSGWVDAIAVTFREHPDKLYSASFHPIRGYQPDWNANPYEITWREDGTTSPIKGDTPYRETAGLSMVRESSGGHVYAITIDIRDSMLSDGLRSLHDQLGSEVILAGNTNIKRYSSVGASVSDFSRIRELSGKRGSFLTQDDHLIVWDTLNTTKWRIAVIFGPTQLEAGLGAIRRVSRTSSLAIMVAAVIVSMLFASIIAKPLRNLSRSVAKVNLDHLENVHFSQVRSRSAEVHQLQESMDAFIDRMNRWQKETTRMHNSLLLSQINPHFLSNTLYAIMQECDLGETEEASEMLADLSTFFRLGLNAGREIVPLHDEVDHTKSYLNIVARSFAYRLTSTFEIPESLKDALVPRMTLQPLVENSYMHGIRLKRCDGTISVVAYQKSGRLVVLIRDDGIGMNQTTLEKLRSQMMKPPIGDHGFGIYNVQQRIHGLYGDPYGITVDSALGAGTTITITLPYLKEDTHAALAR